MKKNSKNASNTKKTTYPNKIKGPKAIKPFDIKDHYTHLGEHPEDRIFKERNFIRELEKVQTLYFEGLSKDLGLNALGEDLLFDYIHNYDEEICFDEYLEKLGKTYKDCLG